MLDNPNQMRRELRARVTEKLKVDRARNKAHTGRLNYHQRGFHKARAFARTPRWEGDMTLKQACSRVTSQAPGAFKDLMTHVLHFALRIAFRCVLHRRKSQDIRCQKL